MLESGRNVVKGWFRGGLSYVLLPVYYGHGPSFLIMVWVCLGMGGTVEFGHCVSSVEHKPFID